MIPDQLTGYKGGVVVKKAGFPAVISVAVMCFLFWLLLTWSFAAEELIAGAVISFAVALFSARFFVHEKAFYLLNPVRIIILVFYCCVIFMWELIKANVDVALRALKPGKLNVNPGIVKVPVDIKSDYGTSMLANSITLTPGTITMDIAKDEAGQKWFYIHWIDVAETDHKKAGDIIKGTLEKWVGRIWP